MGLSGLIEMGAGEAIITREAGCVAIVGRGVGAQRLRGRDRPARGRLLGRLGRLLPRGLRRRPLRGRLAARSASPTASRCGAESTQHLGAGTLDAAEVERLVAGSRFASSTSAPASADSVAGRRASLGSRRSPADDALVLDVGGWASPLPCADWVIDLMPYETRGALREARARGRAVLVTRPGSRPTSATARPWPFADGQFDFSVCGQTLEDLRDPVWVCSEFSRVSRAGYVETPSRLEEQSVRPPRRLGGVDPSPLARRARGRRARLRPQAAHARGAAQSSPRPGAQWEAARAAAARAQASSGRRRSPPESVFLGSGGARRRTVRRLVAERGCPRRLASAPLDVAPSRTSVRQAPEAATRRRSQRGRAARRAARRG